MLNILLRLVFYFLHHSEFISESHPVNHNGLLSKFNNELKKEKLLKKSIKKSYFNSLKAVFPSA